MLRTLRNTILMGMGALCITNCGSSDVSRSIVMSNEAKDNDTGTPEASASTTLPIDLLASDAILSGDMSLSAEGLVQPVTNMDPNTSGLAKFTFLVRDAGAYTVEGDVTAENGNANSFFLDIGSNPVAEHVWHIISQPGPQTVAYGRGGTIADPKPAHEFILSQGIHTLHLRGREAGARLRSLRLQKVSQ